MAYIVQARSQPLYQLSRIVWFVLGVIETLLFVRFFLKFLGANAGAGFVDFMYSITNPLLAPFQAVFSPSYVAGAFFEWTTILAIIVFWLIGWAISSLLLVGESLPSDRINYTHEEYL